MVTLSTSSAPPPPHVADRHHPVGPLIVDEEGERVRPVVLRHEAPGASVHDGLPS